MRQRMLRGQNLLCPRRRWISVGGRVRAFPTRKHLLVSNSGPDGEGYDYCTGCGRIEAVVDPEVNLSQPHTRPHPSDEEGPCPGYVARRIVLGTAFRTDIASFSLPLDSPFRATGKGCVALAATGPRAD